MLQRSAASICFVLVLLFHGKMAMAQAKNSIIVSEQNGANAFPIFTNNITPSFYYDAKDAKVVQIAAEAFTGDINLISDKQMKLNTSNKVEDEFAIVAGTIGHSKIIDDLIKDYIERQHENEKMALKSFNTSVKKLTSRVKLPKGTKIDSSDLDTSFAILSKTES